MYKFFIHKYKHKITDNESDSEKQIGWTDFFLKFFFLKIQVILTSI